MEDTRKGFLVPEQEKITDDLIELKGVGEMVDGPMISFTDNQVLQRLKLKIVGKWGADILPDIYEVIDAIFVPLAAIAEMQKEKE